MNPTGTVLFVHTDVADGGGAGDFEPEFDVVVADDALDAIKRLETGAVAPECVVTAATLPDLPLDAFLSRIERTAPDAATLVVGELPPEPDAVRALVRADEYVPPGREMDLGARVSRLLGEGWVDRAVDLHDRLARRVAEIAVTVADAPDRSAIEAAVYDRLAGGEAYRHVWIARADGEDIDVSLPVSGGIDAEEIQELVGGGDPTFVERAIEAGRVTFTDGLVSTRNSATTAASATVVDGGTATPLSSAAVPFVHDGQVWGIGLVSTERIGAFDGSERELLADLGAVVGHALWALETERPRPGSDQGRGMENLVHDLRNPLGIARSHLEIAREDDDEEALTRVESALDRMVQTIDRVAAGVRGDPNADLEAEDLAEAAGLAWESIEAGAASLDVVESETIRVDRDLFVRLLANLFQNAVDHGGESVTVEVGTLPDGFFVEDDGPGIAADDRDSVFERGYSTSDHGLGVGLSIVGDVAEAHGWSVTVAESDTSGARFEVTGVEFAREDATV